MRFAFFVLSTGAMSFANSLPSRAAASLSLAEAQRVATNDAPQLAAQAAALRAVQQSVITATEQADPKQVRQFERYVGVPVRVLQLGDEPLDEGVHDVRLTRATV